MGLVFETFTRDLLSILAILFAFAWYYVNRKFYYWRDKNVTFEKPSFPFGNFKKTYLQRKSFAEVTVDFYSSGNEPVVGLWSVLKPLLLIRDPEVVQQVLVTDFNSFTDRGFFSDEERDPLSAHLFSYPGERWRFMRGKLTPSFTVGKVRGTFPTLLACGGPLDAFVANVAREEGTVEVRELLAQYTTNIIASVAFGIEIDCIGKPDEPFRKFGYKIFEPSIKNGLRQITSFLYPQLITWLRIRSLDWDVEEFMLSIVRQNIEFREQNNVTRNDFFQLLLQLRNSGTIQEDDDYTKELTNDNKALSVEECAAQTFAFFAAGYETSSTAMSFALYELAKNQDCLRRVHREIDEVLAKHKGQVTYEAISDMKYLDWCIDESFRMYPPLPIVNRVSTEPWTIPNTNSTIEKGTAILIPVMALHRDPKFWPNPERFWPERFSPEQLANTTFTTRPYLPFGDGPRNCIGLRLGKLQTKMGLLVMLQKYNYELAGSTKLPLKMNPAVFMIMPEGGINLKITHRRSMCNKPI